MPDMELKDLVFSLLAFGLALVCSFPAVLLFLPVRMQTFMPLRVESM